MSRSERRGKRAEREERRGKRADRDERGETGGDVRVLNNSNSIHRVCERLLGWRDGPEKGRSLGGKREERRESLKEGVSKG